MDNQDSNSLGVWLNPQAASLAKRQGRWPDEASAKAYAASWVDGILNTTTLTMVLVGDLGAGKTTFTRYLLQAMGVEGRIKSPTYTLMESYTATGGMSVYHFDFYRFHDDQEWEEAGFRDVFASPGLRVVEWPERVYRLLPTPDIVLHLTSETDQSRSIIVHAFTKTGLGILR
jgi:tRNA threonylcarbamoyladenosine biosynthesis protein TsaE